MVLELFSTTCAYAKKLTNKENFGERCGGGNKGQLNHCKTYGDHHDHFTNNGEEVVNNVANCVVSNVNKVVNNVLNAVTANNNSQNNQAVEEVVNGPEVSDTLNDAVNDTLNVIMNTVNEVENNKAVEVMNKVNKANNDIMAKNNNANNANNVKNNLCHSVGLEPDAPTALACVVLALVLIISILPVVLIAVNVFPKNPVLHGILAFFFDRIYLFIIVLLKLKPIANVLRNNRNNRNNKNNKN